MAGLFRILNVLFKCRAYGFRTFYSRKWLKEVILVNRLEAMVARQRGLDTSVEEVYTFNSCKREDMVVDFALYKRGICGPGFNWFNKKVMYSFKYNCRVFVYSSLGFSAIVSCGFGKLLELRVGERVVVSLKHAY